jgi:isochorismate hydrolase
VTEHNTSKYGATHVEVKESLEKCDYKLFPKTTWSMDIPDVKKVLIEYGKIVVIFGIEAHLCVLNSVIDLINEGFKVFLVENAVNSEREEDRLIGLERMRLIGAIPCSIESCIYEICQQEGEEFTKCREVLNGLKSI